MVQIRSTLLVVLGLLLATHMTLASIQVVKNNPNKDRMILLGNSGIQKETSLDISALDLVQFLDHEMTNNLELVKEFGQNQLIKNYSVATILKKMKRAFVVTVEGEFDTSALAAKPTAEFELFESDDSTCVDTTSCFTALAETKWQGEEEYNLGACISKYFSDLDALMEVKDKKFLSNACSAMEFSTENAPTGILAWDLTSEEVPSAVKLAVVDKCVNNLVAQFNKFGAKFHGLVMASHSKTLVHSSDFNSSALDSIEGVISHMVHDDHVKINTKSCTGECRDSIKNLFQDDSRYRVRMLEAEDESDVSEGHVGNDGEADNTPQRMIMGWTGFLLFLITVLVLGGIMLSDQSKDTLLYSKFLTTSEQGPR